MPHVDASGSSPSCHYANNFNSVAFAKQLGVANILEGSVQKAADQVRVNVQAMPFLADQNLH